MANIRYTPNSPYWQAVITLADGNRTNRSTKAKDKTEAERIAREFQDAEDRAVKRNITADHARKVLNDIMERNGHETLNQDTTEQYLRQWAAGKNHPTTAERYNHTVNLFLTHLDNKARGLLTTVTYNDILGFLAKRKKDKVASKTVLMDAKILGGAFNIARKLGIRNDNPVEKALTVQPIDVESSERDVFTPDQVKALVKTAKDEWLTVVMLGYYTGARLSDCVHMEWDNVNLTKGFIEYVPQKTAKRGKAPKSVIVPIHPDLDATLQKLASSDKPETYLCPTLATLGTGGRRGLSQTFKKIMADAGIDAKTGQGQGTRKSRLPTKSVSC